MGRTLEGERHVLLNRDLFNEFAAFLAAASWDIALLQEVPPRWDERLAMATSSAGFRSLTSRNWMSPLISPVARLRPQLAGSWEGGSNLILVRKDRPGNSIIEKRGATLRWWPERRTVSLVRLSDGLCVANLHASTGAARAEGDLTKAVSLALKWAGDAPLLVGGDFNLRPKSSSIFQRLSGEYGFSEPAEEASIDHLLARGATLIEQPVSWKPERRDVPDEAGDLLIRLSDHSPVVARVRTT